MHLDLVICVDTSVGHVAGALGLPYWLALSCASDWRWLQHRDDSPWYPHVRLFRQTQWGDWEGVFERMAAALRQKSRQVSTPIMAQLSLSELFDKIAKLETQRGRLRDERALDNLRQVLGGLLAARACSVKPSAELTRLSGQLRAAHEALCDAENARRQHERREDFGEQFVALARSLYARHDEREAIERQIDDLLGARIAEERPLTREAAA